MIPQQMTLPMIVRPDLYGRPKTQFTRQPAIQGTGPNPLAQEYLKNEILKEM